MDEFLDLVGVVDGADHAAKLGEAFHLPYLEGAGFLAGGFEFDEADLAGWEDYKSVWHACVVGAGEFWGDSAGFANLVDEGFFDFAFEHWFPVLRWWVEQNRGFSYLGV
ncbi:hypothetical protein [Corynebacterium singulare]|uniref:hypothetical protein n=1 Tax=Corynebacterium singulare TaxID=161899 RepID=UPI0016427DB7|nr:hypothetical protein [Corynebacterium singulare]